MSDIMIDAQQVCKNFGQLQVLKGIDLQVPKGNVTCLLGPSGSGKSTFLRCVNHLEKITAGRLYVDGDLIGYRERNGTLYEISEHEAALQRANIGMVFQQFNLFSHRTVLQNIIEAPTQVKSVWAWRTRPMPTPYSCPAASNSAWPSPAPWLWSPSSCCSTSPLPRLTRNSSERS